MTLQTIDMVLTCVANTVIVAGFVYLAFAFLLFVWEKESEKTRAPRRTAVQPQTPLVATEAQTDDDAALSAVPPVCATVDAHLNVDGNDIVNADDTKSDDACVNSTVPLPVILRSNLKIWTGRHRKKVVPLTCLPPTLAVPGTIRRYRWRKTSVIRLSDLETLAVLQ